MTAVFPRIETITDHAEWLRLEADWRALFDASSTASSALRWEWLARWWEVFGPECSNPPGGLHVLIARRGDTLCGALPLFLQCTSGRRRLGFIGSGELGGEGVYPEKLDILATSGDTACTQALLDAVSQLLATKSWDEFDLSLGLEHAALHAHRFSLRACKVFDRTFPAPYADLTGGFEQYLARRSTNSRQQFRRLIRGAEREGYRLDLAETPEQAFQFFEQLVSLHQAHWKLLGETGAFSTARVREFHRLVIADLIALNQVVLAQLTGPKTLAVLYGFVVNNTFDFYQSGIATDVDAGSIKSPGITAHLLLMQQLAARGIHEYDFLAGGSFYKEKLATSSRNFVRRRLLKLTPQNVIFVMREAVRRAARPLRAATRERETLTHE